uniref:(northern house mosquito) hypothetical protein n=1 Tax=Culex pipiens TaxID=7175 RepID=A0A8D8NJT2_CULPI
MVSFQRAKQVPRSASTKLTRGVHRDRVQPLSCSSTGIPVYTRRQSSLPTLSYRLASDVLTYTSVPNPLKKLSTWARSNSVIIPLSRLIRSCLLYSCSVSSSSLM